MTKRKRVPNWVMRDHENVIANTIGGERDVDEIIARVRRTDPDAMPAAMSAKARFVRIRRIMKGSTRNLKNGSGK